jgi:isochorismate hydrolase
MATIYKFDVRCVSAFQAYPEDMIQKVIEDALRDFRDTYTRLQLESIEVKPKKYTFVD